MTSGPGYKKHPNHRLSAPPAHDEMLAIKELVAFYPDKVESISHG